VKLVGTRPDLAGKSTNFNLRLASSGNSNLIDLNKKVGFNNGTTQTSHITSRPLNSQIDADTSHQSFRPMTGR
jgi:hypothetical protein